jgi:hypothetical protein
MMQHVSSDNPDLLRLTRAHRARNAATGDEEIDSTHRDLRIAAEAARDAGLSWSQIGDALGIARGNAYKRYRSRPAPRPDVPGL